MGDAGFQLLGVRDSRIAPHAISVHPAWLWSTDGLRLLWCNAAAAAAFGIRTTLNAQPFSIADPRARQVSQLARRLTPGSLRLERLRDFGKPLGGLLTCACSQLDLEGDDAILIVAMESVGRTLSYDVRLHWVVGGLDQPASIFDGDGRLVASNIEAHDLAGDIFTLSDLGESSPPSGRETRIVESGRLQSRLHFIGNDREHATIALISLRAAETVAPAKPVTAMPGRTPLPTIGLLADSKERSKPAISRTDESADTPSFIDEAPSLVEKSEIDGVSIADLPPSISCPDDGQWTVVRRHPLRFIWQMNAEGRFALGGDEFSRMLGPQTAAGLGRSWDEVSKVFGLDPEGLVAKAVATRDTWSGIIVSWPFDGSSNRLPVELSALPLHDRNRNFLGYRGFGVCHDIDGLNKIAAMRQRDGMFGERTTQQPSPAQDNEYSKNQSPQIQAAEVVPKLAPIEPAPNVVPFRSMAETTAPALTQVENNAFDEIARRLSEGLGATRTARSVETESPFEPFAESSPVEHEGAGDAHGEHQNVAETNMTADKAAAEPAAAWLTAASEPPVGESLADRRLLDLMPSGVLIYRLEQLLYANSAFLLAVGFADLPTLQSAGGLEVLEIEPQSSTASSASSDGMPLTVTTTHAAGEPASGRLFAIEWDQQPAHALILSVKAAATAASAVVSEAETGATSNLTADLNAILEAAADAIVLFDRSGAVTACNRHAQTLFGYPFAEFIKRNLTDLFAFDSQRIILDYFESIDQAGTATIHDHGREVVGCRESGQFLPLSMTMGRSDANRFFAVFRDLSQIKQSEALILQERRRAERATSAKSDVLSKISHDVRAPLNTIIGFANMMIEEKLGSLGNSRYLEYTKDIRASAERVLTIVGDMLDLSEVETGKIKLSFQQQSLNETVEKCVSLAQPQANRERIIIRTSLAHHLPLILADTHALRQIAGNLINSSIRLSKAGGQVIVSTAIDETRRVVLRVRDTGRGLNESEIATTMEPYRAQTLNDMAMPDIDVDLSLTRALAEANHARFHIRSTPQAGTLIEVAFPAA